MGTGFVIVQSTVRIDHVHMADPSLKHSGEFSHTTAQCFLLPWLTSTLDGTHVSVACVEENAEIGMIDILDKLQHFRGLVKEKPRLKFPNQLDSLFLRKPRTGSPQADNSFPGRNSIHSWDAIRAVYRIHANSRRTKIGAKLEILLEKINVVIVLLGGIRSRAFVAPKIGG